MGITPPERVGRKLVYNALAIWYVHLPLSYSTRLTNSVAYLHTLLSFRLPSLENHYLKDSSIEATEIKTELSRLVPSLVDQKSTIRYTTTREAYSSIWERIGEGQASLLASTFGISLMLRIPRQAPRSLLDS